MKAKSLTQRVSITAFAAVLTIGLSLVLLLAATIGPASQRMLVDQMKTQAASALSLDGSMSIDQIAESITRPGTSVAITNNDARDTKESVFVSVDNDTDVASVEVFLPESDASLVLNASNQQASSISGVILAIGLPLVIVIAILIWLVLGFAMRRAMRPLGEMTNLAVDIAGGRRGARLEIVEPNTDLGMTGKALNEMLDNLEGALQLAEDARQSLRQMSLDVAHELKTPLATIVSSAENSMRTAPEAEQKQLVGMIREARRAGKIIGTLTQLQAIEAGGPGESTPSKFDIARLVREICSATTDVEVSAPNAKVLVLADEHQIGQILRNLIENALAHKSLQVVVTITQIEEKVRLTVQDDGPGIAEADRTRIFDRFIRLDASRARNSGGSGLGLAISKALATANNATLWCGQPEEPGAVFILEIASER